MGATAAIIMGVGMGFTAASQWRAGSSQAKLAEYNAKVSENNATVDEIKAQDAIARGYQEETIHRKSTRQIIGSQRASFAAQGVEVNDGSALDVQLDVVRLGELDAITIRTNAAREAWGYKVDAMNDKASADDIRAGGQIAKQAGRNAAVSTVLTGAGSLLQQKYGIGKGK